MHTLRLGIRIDSVDPFWVQVRETVYQHAQQWALDVVSIDVDTVQLEVSAEVRQHFVDEILGQELDALISLYLPDEVSVCLLAEGIAVFHLTETSVRHPRLVSPDFLSDTARMISAYLAEHLSGRGHVLVVGGLLIQVGEDGRSRLAGIRDVFQRYPDIQITHVPSIWMYEETYQQVAEALPQIDGPLDAIFGLSDTVAFAARDAALAQGRISRSTPVVGINGDPLAFAAIADGSLAATVETSAAAYGQEIVELVLRAARREPLPAHFNIQPRLVTAQNVAELSLQKLIALAPLPSQLVGSNHRSEQRRLTQLETSLQITRQIGALLDRQQLSSEIAGLIRHYYGYDQVAIVRWDAAQQVFLSDSPGREAGVSGPLPLAEAGLLAQALQRDELIFIPDTRRGSRFAPDPRWPQTRSRVIAPIHLGPTTLGLLDLHSYRPAHHTHQDLVGVQLLADQVAGAMRNAELYGEALAARAAAEKADQLKTRLLANVSHELRAPVQAILGHADAVLTPAKPGACPPSAETVQHLRQIAQNGEHLSHLINDLLDLSRAEIDALDLFPEMIATHAFLTDVFHSIAEQPPAGGVAWRLALPDRLPLIQADPVRLRQILLNLLSNARKFTADGTIELGAEAAPPHLHLWVRDSGMGIPAEQQGRIFEPFITGEDSVSQQQGIGLGLSITRQLVLLHGGSIAVESAPQRGSTFHVYLPLPALHGSLSVPPAPQRPVMLLLSSGERMPAALLELSQRRGVALQRVRSTDEIEQVLSAMQPVALAWDVACAAPEDWALIQQLRSHPQLCQLPFALYGHDWAAEQELGVTQVVMKPLSSQTLLDALDQLRPTRVAGPVLIVDDDPQARELYRSHAVQALPGVAVRLASGGAAALTLLAEEAPSLVILDLMMPDVDGFAVLAALRAAPSTRQVPVLVISGHALSPEDIRQLNHQRVTFQSKDILADDELVAGLRRSYEGSNLLAHQTSLLVKRAVAYIQRHHARPFARDELAETVGLSKNYLTHIFQQELGLSPWEYLKRYRIKRAKELLRSSKLDIAEVACQVGFDDAAYFSRVFRKEVGIAPSTYRAEHMKSVPRKD
jgi:signal transduction histidine kinase/AraC-like DNA-binding protein/DNA-binding LacI/PurR family transcriptional regulator